MAPHRASPGAARLDRAALVFCLLAGGCTTVSPNVPVASPGPAAPGRDAGWVRVADVALVRQSSRQGCGAAALAMVLGHWGRRVTQDEIWAASPPASGEGLRADALRDFARRQGLQAFLIEGAVDDLDREVGRNRPVLVGVVKRQGRRVYPHYEVVVGIDRRRGRVLVLDPARGRRERALDQFASEWSAAGRLTLIVFPVSGAPPLADATR